MCSTTLPTRLATIALLASSSWLTGCASSTPALDADFGKAVREARTAQTLYPDASKNRDPVLGIDGKAGAVAQERYIESFQAPPKTFEIINIGGAITEK